MAPGEWKGEGGSLNQSLFKGLKCLLGFLRPFETSHFSGETCEWFRYGCEPFYKATIVRGQAKKTHAHRANNGALASLVSLPTYLAEVDSLSAYHVAQKLHFRLEQFTLGWHGLKSYVPKTIEDNS